MKHNELPTIILLGYFTNFFPYFNSFGKLEKMGHKIILPRGSLLSLKNIHTQAKILSEKVNKTLNEYNVKKCNIIGISAGGIVALYYLQELGGIEKIDTFFAVSAPFLGTWSPIFGVMAQFHFFSPSMWELLPISSVLQCILEKPKPDNVKIYSFIAKQDRLVPPSSCFYPHAEKNIELKGGHSHLCQGHSEELLSYIDKILNGSL